MSNRKAATDFLLKYIEKILPGSPNTENYKKLLEGMSDKEFEEFIGRLERGEELIQIQSPNLTKYKLSVERNLDIAKELGHDFFQQLYLTDPVTGVTYLTPKKYLVMDLPLRRQVQLLQKKASIPENNKHVDAMSGQPTGPSKGSRISLPELQVLFAMGLDQTITEFIKMRGGDEKAYEAMNRSILENGGASLEQIAKLGTKVKSVTTLATLLKGMHLDNTLDK